MAEICWICKLLIGGKKSHRDIQKSLDHVIPKANGGCFMQGNLRWAHRICNEYKAHGEVTDDLVRKCRERAFSRGAKEDRQRWE